jgi:hypothetical protein
MQDHRLTLKQRRATVYHNQVLAFQKEFKEKHIQEQVNADPVEIAINLENEYDLDGLNYILGRIKEPYDIIVFRGEYL